MPAVSNARIVDFGRGIGRRSVYLYNLPEVVSGHQTFGVPSISARFGTDPQYWNWAMVLTARLLPKSEWSSSTCGSMHGVRNQPLGMLERSTGVFVLRGAALIGLNRRMVEPVQAS